MNMLPIRALAAMMLPAIVHAHCDTAGGSESDGPSARASCGPSDGGS